MNKKNDQNAEIEIMKLKNEASNIVLEEKKLAYEEKMLTIEEQKLILEKDKHHANLLVEREKIKLEKSKTWVTPVFTTILAIISLSATAYVAYWSRKEIEASRIEVYTHTSNKKMPNCRACWKKYSDESGIGFKGRVNFTKTFNNKPNIITVLSLINLKTPKEVVESVSGKKMVEINEQNIIQTPNQDVKNRIFEQYNSLDQINIHCYATEIDSEGFTLIIRYGIKHEFINLIKSKLEQTPDPNLVRIVTT
jgi:hypothetical protein